MPPVMTGRQQVDTRAVLAALAEPRRADIIQLLELRYCSQRELSEELGMSQPLVSHHLKVLRDVGLVTSTVCERVTVYVLRPSTLTELCRRMERLAEHAREIVKVKPC